MKWTAREWVSASAWRAYLSYSLYELILGSRLNILLLCIPVRGGGLCAAGVGGAPPPPLPSFLLLLCIPARPLLPPSS